jgi:cytochrome oxidase Cu insertion factor (SCO1/SenC/PrrC family)
MKQATTTRHGLKMGALAVALVGLLGAAAWSWQAWRPGSRQRAERPLEGLAVFGSVPDVSLIQRDGRRVTLADLRGKVWIANFIYTHCTDTCPLQSAQMARLQEELRSEPDFRLVSITVDPEQDTPETLTEYATRFGADRERWLFLTGEKRAVYTLAVVGFRLSVADPEELDQGPRDKRAPSGSPQTRQENPFQQPEGRVRAITRFLQTAGGSLLEPAPARAHPGHPAKPFIHSSRFALVDRQARIRGYYQSNDEEALGRLRRDARILLRENQPESHSRNAVRKALTFPFAGGCNLFPEGR